jgi:hypothetical protein
MAAAKEVPRAHTRPESLVLMASPSERQSLERGQLRVARRMAETGAPVKGLPDVQLTLKGRDADRGGNRSQIRRQGSALLPRYVAEARTQQYTMHSLDLRLLIHLLDRFRNPFSPSTQAMKTSERAIYTAPTVAAAEQALDEFGEIWDATHPTISQIWRRNWPRIIPPDADNGAPSGCTAGRESAKADSSGEYQR